MANEILTTLHPDQDPDTNLYPNIKKDNIPNKSIDLSKLDDNVLSMIGSIHPSGVDTSSNILSKTSDDGIWIGSDTGKWYYWDGSQYVEGSDYISNIDGVVFHNGSQLKDNNDNDFYPNVDDLKIYRSLDYDETPKKFGLLKSISTIWEMGMYDHNNSYNSTTRCRSRDFLNLVKGKNTIHLLDNSVRFFVYRYLNGTYVDTLGGGWLYNDYTFIAEVGYEYKIVASFNPERVISDITEVTSKILFYTQVDYSMIINNPKNALLKGICHRGYRSLAPENSIEAFRIAKLYGFSYIETDVQFTSDNVPVMFHDDYINDKSSYSGENKRISDFTYNELLNYDFGSWFSPEFTGLQILSFDDFLITMKKFNLISFIEIKTPSSMTTAQGRILYDKVLSKGMKYNVYWLGYDILSLARLREIDNDMNFAPAVPLSSITIEGLNGFDQTFPNPHDLVIFTDINNINAATNEAFIGSHKKCGTWAVDNSSTNANVLKSSQYCCEYIQTDGINVLELFLN